MRSCQLPAGAVPGKVVTIEGLSPNSTRPVQAAWLAHQAPQCGYCRIGQIMAAVALLNEKPQPTDAGISEAMTSICRCGACQRIRTAIHNQDAVCMECFMTSWRRRRARTRWSSAGRCWRKARSTWQ